jgi:predicted HAD superfamily Cof-like phosphohydrolase
MTNTPFQEVGEFHKAFGHPWYQKGRHPVIDSKLVKLRLRLIFEELEELCEALFVKEIPVVVHEPVAEIPDIVENGGPAPLPEDVFIQGFKSLFTLIEEHIGQMTDEDLELDTVEIADALGDINYVVNGAAHAFNLELDAITSEIHRSNMSKLGADGKPIYRATDNKVVKGPNYTPPDIKKVLENT